MIYAQEGRDKAIFDTPGAYLNSNMPKGKAVLLKLEVKFVDIICDVNLELKEHVRYDK